MKCPVCGNEVYDLVDYAIARCTNCYSLWDPYTYPGFPAPDVEPGEIWDTSDHENNDPFRVEDDDDFEKFEDEDQEGDDLDEGDFESDDEDAEFDEEEDEWDDDDDDQEDDW